MPRALRLAFAAGADAPMSPAAIAAGVPKSQELIEAEQKAADLHAERESNIARVTELEPFLDDPIERRDAGREIRDLILRRRVLEPEISALRSDLIRMRREHEGKVAAALYPFERAAAEGALTALAALRSSAAVLNEIRVEQARAGGRGGAPYPVHVPATEIERAAHTIMARGR
jgi:hypothetical protein